MVIIEWRKYSAKSRTGAVFESTPYYPGNSGALLLAKLLDMPREGRVQIGYDEANAMVGTEVCRCIEESNYAMVAYLTEHWVEWITSLGFFIEIEDSDYTESREITV